MLSLLVAATAPAWMVAAWQALLLVLVGFLFWLLAGVLNWYLWWDTAENWNRVEQEHPKFAFAVRLLRAFGPHFRKLVVAWRDYAANRAKSTGLDAPVFNPANPAIPPPPPVPSPEDDVPTVPGFKRPTKDG